MSTPLASEVAEQVPARRESGSMHVAPPPWDYNPSSWAQRIPICLIAMVGFVIAAYLGLYQWRLISHVWDPVFGDQSKTVLDSEVSHKMRAWFHIPDAAFGAFAYLGDAIFGLAGSTRRWQYRPWLVILFGIDVIPLGIVGAVLVFLQGAAVGAWCFLCIASAVISLLLVFLAYDEVWSSLTYLGRVWKHTRRYRVVWNTFWGRASREAAEVAFELPGRA